MSAIKRQESRERVSQNYNNEIDSKIHQINMERHLTHTQTYYTYYDVMTIH